jgi:quinol monooxygenase YgiN
MSVHVVAELVAQPGQEAAMRQLLTPFALQSRTEPGCLHYDLYEDAAAPGRFLTVEVWADKASIEAHMATPQIQAALPVLGPMLAKPFTQTMLTKLT